MLELHHFSTNQTQADMKCSSEFPFHKVKSVRPAASVLEAAGSGAEFATPFEALALQNDVFSIVLEHLSHTDRANLFRVSVTCAAAVSDGRNLWTVDDKNLMYSEYTAKELERFKEDGDLEHVSQVRGARVSQYLSRHGHLVYTYNDGAFLKLTLIASF